MTFSPLDEFLLAVYDHEFDRPIKGAARLLALAERERLVERQSAEASRPVRLTPKGLAYLHATRAIEPSQPIADQHLGFVM